MSSRSHSASRARTPFRVAAAFLSSISTHREMADGVARFAAEHDWIIRPILTRPDALQSFPALTAANFDGAIGDFAQPPFDRLFARGADIPLVLTDPDLIDRNATARRRNYGRLLCDNASIANAAADALLARGAASYVYVNMRRTCYWSLERERVSRRTLETRFRRATGRSLHDEIASRRLARVKEMLATTDAKLQSIADQTGFASASHLTETFRRAFDLTPGAFRPQAK